MTMVTDSFITFADTMKFHTIEFLIIIKINIINITLKLSGVKFMIAIIIVISIITNIIKSRSTTTKLSCFIIAVIIMTIVIITNTITSFGITMKPADIKFLTINIIISIINAIINIIKLLFADVAEFFIIV